MHPRIHVLSNYLQTLSVAIHFEGLLSATITNLELLPREHQTGFKTFLTDIARQPGSCPWGFWMWNLLGFHIILGKVPGSALRSNGRCSWKDDHWKNEPAPMGGYRCLKIGTLIIFWVVFNYFGCYIPHCKAILYFWSNVDTEILFLYQRRSIWGRVSISFFCISLLRIPRKCIVEP